MRLLLLALLALAAVPTAQTNNRSIQCVQFVPSTTPGTVDLQVRLGLEASSEGVDKDLSVVVDVFSGGALIHTDIVNVMYNVNGGCPGMGCAGSCQYSVNLNTLGGSCTSGCLCNAIEDPGLYDVNLMIAAPGGPTVTVTCSPTATALFDTDPSDDSMTVGFDGYYRCEPLSVDVLDVSLSMGTSQSLELNFGPDQANRGYIVLGSMAGTSPGSSFGGQLVPLNFDGLGGYLLFSLNNVNGPIFTGTLGTLDGNGYARNVSVNVPPMSDTALAGINIHHAAMVFMPGGGLAVVSNPTPMSFTL